MGGFSTVSTPPYAPVAAKATYTTTFSTTSTTYVDITGIAVSVTLTRTANVLVYVVFRSVYNSVRGGVFTKIVRDTTDLKEIRLNTNADANGYVPVFPFELTFLDKDVPAGTYTYKAQGYQLSGTGYWEMSTSPGHGEIGVVVF